MPFDALNYVDIRGLICFSHIPKISEPYIILGIKTFFMYNLLYYIRNFSFYKVISKMLK